MPGMPLPPRHARWLHSDDPDEVTSWVRRRDGEHSRVVHGTGPFGFKIAFLEGRCVNLGWGRSRLGQTLRARFDQPHVQVPLEVAQQYSFGRTEMSVSTGTPVFIGTGTDCSRRAESGCVFALEFEDSTLVAEVRARRQDKDVTLPRMPRALKLSMAQRRAFGGAVGELAAALDPNMPLARQAHAESQVVSLLADVLLDTSSHVVRQGRLSAQRLNDLEDWIDAHLGEPITIGRLCSVVGVGERSLQLAFSARRGMSPMRFVTEQRLQAAHRRLSASDGISDITRVAIELGFTHMGRFSMAYRDVFGELPSRTRLRSQRKAK